MASPVHELDVCFNHGGDDDHGEYLPPLLVIEESDDDCTRQMRSDMSAAKQVQMFRSSYQQRSQFVGRSVRSRKQLDIGIFDISRAHFMSEADRELFRENADEARAPGGDVVGWLNRSTYGFRDARNNGMRHWQSLLQSEGCAAGKANPALFFQHTANFARCPSRRRLQLSSTFVQSGGIQVQGSWHECWARVKDADDESVFKLFLCLTPSRVTWVDRPWPS